MCGVEEKLGVSENMDDFNQKENCLGIVPEEVGDVAMDYVLVGGITPPSGRENAGDIVPNISHRYQREESGQRQSKPASVKQPPDATIDKKLDCRESSESVVSMGSIGTEKRFELEYTGSAVASYEKERHIFPIIPNDSDSNIGFLPVLSKRTKAALRKAERRAKMDMVVEPGS